LDHFSARTTPGETEELIAQFVVVYPDGTVLRAYQLSWFDAHMWAFAEALGLSELLSEDFEHGRLHGSVLVTTPSNYLYRASHRVVS
jgi:hypothetical protein